MRVTRAAAAAALLFVVFPLAARGASTDTCGCPDPLAVVTSFYNATDAGRYAAGARMLAEKATVDTWATGVNGYTMARRHLAGRNDIQRHMGDIRGLRRRLPGSPEGGPVYYADRIKVIGRTVHLMLEPDRMRPNGRHYNPFSVEAVIEGCLITSLTVIEQVTWL